MVRIRQNFVKDRFTKNGREPHFMEFYTLRNGVHIINNSGSVDVDSTWYALEQVDKPCIWIVGGVDKGEDFSVLADLVSEKVKAIICLGTQTWRLIKQFENVGPVLLVNANSIEEAVQHASVVVREGETILFSPACPSYDMFENFEQRGELFKDAIKNYLND
jgi:UDP-N-acetylmuramoylalanine--D-glutamate ligase